MDRATIQQKKAYAQLLYTREGVETAKELALRVGITEKTAGKWIAEGKWKSLKVNLLMGREEQLAALYEELEQMNAHIKTKPEGKRFADSKEADARRKLIADIEALETNTSAREIISVQRSFIDWLKPIDLEKAQEIIVLFDAFLKTKLR